MPWWGWVLTVIGGDVLTFLGVLAVARAADRGDELAARARAGRAGAPECGR